MTYFVSQQGRRSIVVSPNGDIVGEASSLEWAEAVAAALTAMDSVVEDVQTFDAAMRGTR